MPAVGASAGCPSGLEYLTQIDSVIIKQQVDLIEGIMVRFDYKFKKYFW